MGIKSDYRQHSKLLGLGVTLQLLDVYKVEPFLMSVKHKLVMRVAYYNIDCAA